MPDAFAASAEPEKPDSFGSEPDEPTVAEKAEATLDAAIEKALGPDEDAPAAKKPGDAKRAKAKASVDVEDDEEAPELDEDEEELEAEETDEFEDSAEAEEEEASEEDEDDDMALHRAYTLLHDKVGVPASVLKRTSKAELIAWAERVVDGAAKATEAASKAEPGRETQESTKETGKPASTWAARRAALANGLGVDEEAAEVFKDDYDTIESLRAELKEVRDELKSIGTSARERDGQMTIDKELRRLGETYPELRKSEKKQDAIVEEASTIIAGLKAKKAPIDVRKVFDKAARVVLQGSALAHKRRNGFSTPPETLGATRSEAAMDEDSYWNRGVDLALAGKGPAAIARLKPPPPKPKRRP